MTESAIAQISLDTLAPSQHAFICSVAARDDIRRRLQELGFLPGAEVVCLMRAPSGDPTAYRICSAVIALRREDAQRIRISFHAPEHAETEVLAHGS